MDKNTDSLFDNFEVDRFILTIGDKVPPESKSTIRQVLMELDLDEPALMSIFIIKLKDPIITLLLAFCNLDHFYLGKVDGIFKLITCGGLGVWSIIDLFTAFKRTRKTNYEKIQKQILKYSGSQYEKIQKQLLICSGS